MPTNSPTVAHYEHSTFFIDGDWVDTSATAVIDLVDSRDEEVFARVPAGDVKDIGRAVTAARKAFDKGEWSRLTPAQRAPYLRIIADVLESKSAELADSWTREAGVLFAVATKLVPDFANVFRYYADLAETFPFVERRTPTAGGEVGWLVREPAGVVAAIVPWNAPLASICWKVAPALLAGCSVVLKVSPEAPLEGYAMAEACAVAGIPPGVLNMVVADRGASEALVRDPRVDKVTFTGSTATGRRIAGILAERIGRATLELGGKSAAVVLDDADVELAARQLAGGACAISGQVCSSLTRIVTTPRSHARLVDALEAEFGRVIVGDPFDRATRLGPLASAAQRSRVESLIASGVDGGARLVTGGRRPAHLDRGYYVEPTLFDEVDNNDRIAQEEIFGPVLSVIPVQDEDEAVAVANDTIYGLNASVFTPDPEKAMSIARRLRSGTVGHNAFRSDFGIAFGGFKQSGIGREGGAEGLLGFLESKTVILDG